MGFIRLCTQSVCSTPLFIDPPFSQQSYKPQRQSTIATQTASAIEMKRIINGFFTEAVWNPTFQNTLKIDHREIKMEQENYGEPLNILGEFSRMFMRMKPNTFQPVLVGNVFLNGFFDPLTQQFYVLRFITLSKTEEWKRILL